MADIYPPAVQRPRLLELAAAIDSRASCLRRDECGDWRLSGREGHIFAAPEGFAATRLEYRANPACSGQVPENWPSSEMLYPPPLH